MVSKEQKIIRAYSEKDSAYWTHAQSQALRRLASRTRTIPAYRALAEKHRGKELVMSKKNYFHLHPLAQVMRAGELTRRSSIATSTSGSTGIPTYFLRDNAIDWQYSVLAEFFLENGGRSPTLFIDCFGMGVWIGGLISYQAFRLAGLRGYPVSIITPGINKKEIFNALKLLAPAFGNVILAGYPPFIKDVLDEAASAGVDIKKFRIRLLFAAESFTEGFRDYVCEMAGTRDPYHDTLNIYGSAEAGAMAFETPTAILIRRLAVKSSALADALFEPRKLPTLAQYNPSFVTFESREGEVLLSCDSAMPLLRYQIGDHGGTATFDEVVSILEKQGVNLQREAKKAGVRLTRLPFVWVYERSDFSKTLYGLQVYPQTIKRALEQPHLLRYLTGKFAMETRFSRKSDQYLEINLEMKQGVKIRSKLRSEAERSVVMRLVAENSEYRELARMLSESRTKPRIVLWPFGHERYFKTGIKQRWALK